MIGRTLELDYVGGDPVGLVAADTFNWTGQILLVPGARLVKGLAESDAAEAGVCLLTGERGGEQLAYVGESEELAFRINNLVKLH